MVVEHVELGYLGSEDFRCPESLKKFNWIVAESKTLTVVYRNINMRPFQDEAAVEALQVWDAKMYPVASQVVQLSNVVSEVNFELRVVVSSKVAELHVQKGHDHAAFYVSNA